MIEQQLAGNHVRDRNAENASALRRQHAVGRIFQRNCLIGCHIQIMQSRAIELRMGLLMSNAIAAAQSVKVVKQAESG